MEQLYPHINLDSKCQCFPLGSSPSFVKFYFITILKNCIQIFMGIPNSVLF